MNALRKLQHEFQNYLLDDSRLDIAERIVSTPERSARQRMLFYGNAYRMRLKEALGTDYERLHAYLGDELFESLIQQYIDHYPSRHPSLRNFGAHMVDLVSTLEPFNKWPEVEEITRIEQAFGNSFDAADHELITLQQLADLPPAAWTLLTLKFHDSVQLLSQRYNSFQIWQALSCEQTPPAKVDDNSSWLLWRQDLVSRYRSLQSAELAALNVAISSGSFVAVCETLIDYFSEQEVPQRAISYLQQWTHDQMVSALGY